jgi:ABC-type amino acid transport substrate-binding protein
MKAQLAVLFASILLCTFGNADAYCLWKGNEELKAVLDNGLSLFYQGGTYKSAYNKYWDGEPLSVLDSDEKFVLTELPEEPLPGGVLSRVLERGELVVEKWSSYQSDFFEEDGNGNYGKRNCLQINFLTVGYLVDVLDFVAAYVSESYETEVEVVWRQPYQEFSESALHGVDVGFADVYVGYGEYLYELNDRFREELVETGSFWADSSSLAFGPLADRQENPVYSWAALAREGVRLAVVDFGAYAGVLAYYKCDSEVFFYDDAAEAAQAALDGKVHAVLGPKRIIDALVEEFPELHGVQNYGPVITERLAVRRDVHDCELECPVGNKQYYSATD